ncbi:hypothetical protein [Sporolituus thermophilus]|uniref:Uncharacterized protein n=1 Tax=Sporolituus thermophilus DSM 23256 TaxID=1123285 RepID=A0A1G7IND8_9FIRM|nr:hypothetical protein [Sporolituus thermophilus]SDF14098.1 hypothetical protein SAMN05660235_00547 [Sporolituus thermophilus DSM 23256]
MGIFKEIRNECLIKELSRELNTDVLLFGFDGFVYFGNLQAIDDCRVAFLTPAIEADTNAVTILTPGGERLEVEFANVDLWQVIAKGTGIAEDPLEEVKAQTNNGKPVPNAVADARIETERQESHELIRQLRRRIGDEVVITTLGGFLFEGVLTDVRDELAILRVEDIFVPGTSDAISGDDVRSVVVNLEALTSVSGATT